MDVEGQIPPKYPMRKTSFHWSRKKVRLINVGLAFALGVGVLIIAYGDRGAQIIGVVWVAGFAWLMAVLVRRSRSTEPVVTVSPVGVLDIRYLDQPIPWSDIARIEKLKLENMAFLGIVLWDETKYLSQVHWFVRASRWPNKLFRFPLISISMHTLDGSNSDLEAAIAEYRPNLSTRSKV